MAARPSGVRWPAPSGDLVVIEGWWPAWRSVQASPKMCRASKGVGVDDQGPCPSTMPYLHLAGETTSVTPSPLDLLEFPGADRA